MALTQALFSCAACCLCTYLLRRSHLLGCLRLSPLQARDRRVLGLVECLRLAAPRAPPHQEPAITQRLWSIAKAYWLQAGAAATAAQQQLLAAARGAAADGRGSPTDSSGSSSSSSSGGSAALNGSAVPSLGPLLAGLQAAGLKLSRDQLAAAQSLISARQEDAVRQQAWVSALWGLASIGGPLFFQAEVDALAQVRGRPGGGSLGPGAAAGRA
jgi:hypothetical protein